MGKYLFFDIDGTLISKKTIKEIKQTCKNSHKAFKCIKAPISIIKDVNNIGFNESEPYSECRLRSRHDQRYRGRR